MILIEMVSSLARTTLHFVLSGSILYPSLLWNIVFMFLKSPGWAIPYTGSYLIANQKFHDLRAGLPRIWDLEPDVSHWVQFPELLVSRLYTTSRAMHVYVSIDHFFFNQAEKVVVWNPLYVQANSMYNIMIIFDMLRQFFGCPKRLYRFLQEDKIVSKF